MTSLGEFPPGKDEDVFIWDHISFSRQYTLQALFTDHQDAILNLDMTSSYSVVLHPRRESFHW